MRMNELEQRCGIPRSAIRYYIQQGLVPPPEKPTQNSAIYSCKHLELLCDLARLRRGPLGPLPLPVMKRIALRLSAGMSLEIALELEKAIAGNFDHTTSCDRLTFKGLCKEASISTKLAARIKAADLLICDPGDGKYDMLDVEVVKVIKDLLDITGLSPEVGKPIAKKIREITQLEMKLRSEATKGKDAKVASKITLKMQQAIQIIRTYLFFRMRLVELSNELGIEDANQNIEKN